MTESSSPLLDPSSAWAEPPGLKKTLTIGLVIGVAASMLGVGGAFLIGGQGWGTAIGMGVFVAFWGGLGFGGMIAGVVWATRLDEAVKHEQLQAAAATETAAGSAEDMTNQMVSFGSRADEVAPMPERVAS